jgi:hypothetical protein
MERRFQLLADMEIRGSGRGLQGYAAVFDREARIGNFVEVVRPSAFTKTLAENRDIIATADHDATKILGRTGAGTLRLATDSRGLHFEIEQVPDTTAGRDVLELVRSGNVGGCSFTFAVRSGGDVWESQRRSLIDLDLYEVAVISGVPAYSGTIVSARSQPDGRTALYRRFVMATS